MNSSEYSPEDHDLIQSIEGLISQYYGHLDTYGMASTIVNRLTDQHLEATMQNIQRQFGLLLDELESEGII
jgi:hypothetical protein